MDAIRNGLVKAGVRNLKQFGYPSVDENNILTDYVFGKFFLSMLEDFIEDHVGLRRSVAEDLHSEVTANVEEAAKRMDVADKKSRKLKGGE